MRAARRRWAPWALLAPSLAWLALFFAYPMVRAFQLAFQDETGGWGLAAVRETFGDPRFLEALLATLDLLALIIPVQFALAMGMALVVNACAGAATGGCTSTPWPWPSASSGPAWSGSRSSPRPAGSTACSTPSGWGR